MDPNNPTLPPQPVKLKVPPMVVLQKNEQVIAIIKRHPFGIVALYVGAFFGIAIAAFLALWLIPNVGEQIPLETVRPLTYALIIVVTVVMLVVLGLATIVYWQNQWVVTTDSITQVAQRGLFNRQVSQLSMDNLEDVTVDQVGIIAKIFNFGTLRVETAGERAKFLFVYCPRPNRYAHEILEAHETFMEGHNA